MNDKITPSTNQAPAQASSGVSRRRLVRAGLASAPVLAALKSNTVLAGEHSCIRPSAFSSLEPAGMTVSKGRVVRDDFECKSHGYWKNHNGNLTSTFKETLFLDPLLGPSVTGFTENPGGAFTGKTLQNVLDMGGGEQNLEALARHVVAAFLSAKSVGNDPERVLLTVSQCQTIWNSRGNWSPFAGANWTLADTMRYFDRVFGPAFL